MPQTGRHQEVLHIAQVGLRVQQMDFDLVTVAHPVLGQIRHLQPQVLASRLPVRALHLPRAVGR